MEIVLGSHLPVLLMVDDSCSVQHNRLKVQLTAKDLYTDGFASFGQGIGAKRS